MVLGGLYCKQYGPRSDSSTFPASLYFCCLLSHLLMFLGSLFCKQYGQRSEGSSLIRVHSVCFHDRWLDAVFLLLFFFSSLRFYQPSIKSGKLILEQKLSLELDLCLHLLSISVIFHTIYSIVQSFLLINLKHRPFACFSLTLSPSL